MGELKSLYRLNVEELKNFVISRKVENGFAFCNILPLTLQKTYYGVYILKSLNVDIPNKEKIVEFLMDSLKKECIQSITCSIFCIYLE